MACPNTKGRLFCLKVTEDLLEDVTAELSQVVQGSSVSWVAKIWGDEHSEYKP